MKNKENNILLGDNVELTKEIKDETIDLIFADPPYNMNLQKDLIRFDGTKFDGVDDSWDQYDSLKDYDNECKKWLTECLRILKKDGSLWVIGSFQNIHRLGYILQDMDTWIINEIVWDKKNPVPNFGGTRFVNSQETMLWVTKSKKSKFTFNYKTMKHINGGTQMKSVWSFAICSGNERLKDEDGKKVHSTQKPLELLERIILATSKVGDIVLDPFSGTGTTAHAAKKWGRKYIGLEQCEKYYEASLERLKLVEEEMNQDDLKLATYDIKPDKVTFKELIDEGYIDIKNEVKINSKDFVLYFDEDGNIEFENEKLTPNQICRKIFQKPTNAWDWMTIDNVLASDIREKYRENKYGTEINNSN
ncbi:MAG: DNA methyltransferase [Mycoplasma sp.]